MTLFPAYAGVIPTLMGMFIQKLPFPRIRGGDPDPETGDLIHIDFSPHTRG